ncbi:MAG: prepilin-type N-terminal cleavage/methylation domain-containing protein [Gammaproteobacteria bacterium]|nr:prepilin-type N-terminal cleavage/methylation domain-containing protein [Gammaproteobacteria bacterium]
MKVQAGFTLVELVIALVLAVIVTAFAGMFIGNSVTGYTDQVRRAALVDAADSALGQLARDIRGALPNSVRVTPAGGGFAVELLASTDGVRYRDAAPPADPARWLQFDSADDQFNALGGFQRVTLPFSSTSHYLSVYNAGVPGADAWELANVITPPGTQIDIVVDAIAGEHHVTVTPAFRFAYPSPTQRAYLVSGPVSWLCDPSAGTLTRYSGYAIASNHLSRDSAAELLAAGAAASRIADDVSACSLNYTSGTAQRSGLVSARLELERSNERVALMQQVHVVNVP